MKGFQTTQTLPILKNYCIFKQMYGADIHSTYHFILKPGVVAFHIESYWIGNLNHDSGCHTTPLPTKPLHNIWKNFASQEWNLNLSHI